MIRDPLHVFAALLLLPLGATLAADEAVAAGSEFILDLLTFGDRRDAGTLQRGDVHENILAAVFGLNESKTLGRVEPLYGSSSHNIYL